MIAKINKIVAIFAKAVAGITFAAYIAMMLLIVADVIVRNITGSAIQGTYEIVERLLMIGVFAALAYTQTKHGHVHVTMVISHLPFKVGLILSGITSVFSTVAILAVAYASFLQSQFALSAHTTTGVLYIPLYPFYIIETIGMAIFAIAVIWDAVKSFIALGNRELAEDIRSTWD